MSGDAALAKTVLDHVVFNALFETDAAETLFTRLGFLTTPRGYHSLGSINHLMVFESAYLELAGLPLGTTRLREELRTSPLGLNGLVYRTTDAGQTYRVLVEMGLSPHPPQDFSRPVVIGEQTHLAAFTTVRLPPTLSKAGRVYFCEHKTPHLIWRPEWRSHENSVTAIAEMVAVSSDPKADAELHGMICHTSPTREGDAWHVAVQDFRLTFTSQPAFATRYGPLVNDLKVSDHYFGALVLRTPSLDRIRRALLDFEETRDIREAADSLSVCLPTLNAILEFVS